jgi:hypothetical protein
MQAIFSAIFSFVAISIYPSILMVLYATIYTRYPVARLKFYKFLLICPNLWENLLL